MFRATFEFNADENTIKLMLCIVVIMIILFTAVTVISRGKWELIFNFALQVIKLIKGKH